MCVCRTKRLGAESIAQRSVPHGSFLGHGRNYWSNLASLVPHLQCRKFKKFKRQRMRWCSQKQIEDNCQLYNMELLQHGQNEKTTMSTQLSTEVCPWRPLETRMQMKQCRACSAYAFGLSTSTHFERIARAFSPIRSPIFLA